MAGKCTMPEETLSRNPPGLAYGRNACTEFKVPKVLILKAVHQSSVSTVAASVGEFMYPALETKMSIFPKVWWIFSKVDLMESLSEMSAGVISTSIDFGAIAWRMLSFVR